jgi:hypothetical protein
MAAKAPTHRLIMRLAGTLEGLNPVLALGSQFVESEKPTLNCQKNPLSPGL